MDLANVFVGSWPPPVPRRRRARRPPDCPSRRSRPTPTARSCSPTPPTPGTKATIELLLRAFAYNINLRIADEGRAPVTDAVRVREMGVRRDGLRARHRPRRAPATAASPAAAAPTMEPVVIHPRGRPRRAGVGRPRAARPGVPGLRLPLRHAAGLGRVLGRHRPVRQRRAPGPRRRRPRPRGHRRRRPHGRGSPACPTTRPSATTSPARTRRPRHVGAIAAARRRRHARPVAPRARRRRAARGGVGGAGRAPRSTARSCAASTSTNSAWVSTSLSERLISFRVGGGATPMLTTEQVAEAADALFDAERDHAPITPISETYPDADVEDAYRIATAVTELKLKAGRTREGPQDRPHVEGHALAHRRHRARLRHDVRRLVRPRGQPYRTGPHEPAAGRGGAGVRAPRAARRPQRQRRRRDPGHRLRAAVHRDRRHPPEGPGARRRSSTASPTPPPAGWWCWAAGPPA